MIRALFEQFKPRATQTLLFLKNVRKISVYERGSLAARDVSGIGDDDTGGFADGTAAFGGSDSEPRLLYEVGLTRCCSPLNRI
jgi:hypothetical protein